MSSSEFDPADDRWPSEPIEPTDVDALEAAFDDAVRPRQTEHRVVAIRAAALIRALAAEGLINQAHERAETALRHMGPDASPSQRATVIGAIADAAAPLDPERALGWYESVPVEALGIDALATYTALLDQPAFRDASDALDVHRVRAALIVAGSESASQPLATQTRGAADSADETFPAITPTAVPMDADELSEELTGYRMRLGELTGVIDRTLEAERFINLITAYRSHVIDPLRPGRDPVVDELRTRHRRAVDTLRFDLFSFEATDPAFHEQHLAERMIRMVALDPDVLDRADPAAVFRWLGDRALQLAMGGAPMRAAWSIRAIESSIRTLPTELQLQAIEAVAASEMTVDLGTPIALARVRRHLDTVERIAHSQRAERDAALADRAGRLTAPLEVLLELGGVLDDRLPAPLATIDGFRWHDTLESCTGPGTDTLSKGLAPRIERLAKALPDLTTAAAETRAALSQRYGSRVLLWAAPTRTELPSAGGPGGVGR